MSSSYASSSMDPLPKGVHDGMIAMGFMGLVSTTSTLSLLLFITYRMIYWRKYYAQPIATNQIFILIYNLLLADFQQALSFLLAFYWVAQQKLVGPSAVCFAQGWLIQIGDVSSGLWVLTIAIHTFIRLVLQKTLPFPVFAAGVVGIWIFCLALSVAGPLQDRVDFFVPAGVWCWIGQKHESDRLTLHYLWIFMSQLGSLVLYIGMFFYLRTRVSGSVDTEQSVSQDASAPSVYQKSSKPAIGTTTTIASRPYNDPFAASRQKIMKTARNMILYPIAYISLSLPLAAGRVAAMTGRNPPLIYYIFAGSMMATCGFVDVILYLYTRKALVMSNVGSRPAGSSQDHSLPRYTGNAAARRDGWRNDWSEEDSSPSRPHTGDTDFTDVDKAPAFLGGAIVVESTITRVENSEVDADAGFSRTDSTRNLVGKRNSDLGEKHWRS